MLLTDNKARSDVVVVDAARTYSALVKFRDECVPLLDEIAELNAAISSRYEGVDYADSTKSWDDPHVLQAIGYVQVDVQSKDPDHEVRVLRLQGFKHLNSEVNLHFSGKRKDKAYHASKRWHVGTPDWAASPAFVSRKMDNLRGDLNQDINIAKMATQDYAVSRSAVDDIACMEDGTFYKNLVGQRDKAQKSLNYLVEHDEEIKAEAAEFRTRQERAEKEQEKKKEELQEKVLEDTAEKSLAERDTRTPEEKARAEASFWKTIAGVVVFIAAVIIGWKTGITK